MWKLIYSDYEQDKTKNKLNRVHGNFLTNIHDTLNEFSIVNKTRFTVVGLYADKKKYTVIARTTNPLYNYVFATKLYSTHKDNTKHWLTVVDLSNDRMTELVVNSQNLLKDVTNYIAFINSVTKVNAYPLDNINRFIKVDSINNNFDNGQFYNASIVEIDRIWVEQLRGENLIG